MIDLTSGKGIENLHKTAIRALFAAIDRHDFAAFQGFFASDAVCHAAGAPEPLPIDVGVRLIKAFGEAFPDSRHAVKDILTEGDRVAVRFVLEGTHLGDFSGVPPTGVSVRVEGMHFYRFVEGKIAEFWIVEDKLDLLQQLGMKPGPKQ